LSDESDKNKLKRMESILQKIDIPYEYIEFNTGGGNFKPALVINGVFQEITFNVFITIKKIEGLNEWFLIRCLVYDVSKLDVKKVNEVLKLCLSLNYLIPETTFSLYENSIFIEAEMPLDIDVERFNFEIIGIELGLANFLKKMKNIGLEVSAPKFGD